MLSGRLSQFVYSNFKINRIGILLTVSFAFLLLNSIPAEAFQSEPVIAGYRDFNYNSGGVTSKPTEEKPESKLWYHDNSWWGVLWDPVRKIFRVHKYDMSTHSWLSVGPDLDERGRSGSDVFSENSTLYVTSRARLSHDPNDGSELARLYRLTYDTVSQNYTLDSGFPVEITGTKKTKALVITKNSIGNLWATWTVDNKVMVNRTLNGDHTNWGTAFVMPVQGGDLDPDDIATIISFLDDRIGILWSNQKEDKYYFAVHIDNTSDKKWLPKEVAFEANATKVADNHLNFACNTNDGTIVGAVKTSLVGVNDPEVLLLKRDPLTGTWTNYTVWVLEDGMTRPIALLNSDTDNVYVFAKEDLGFPQAIFMKSTSLQNPNFSSGQGALFIKSPTDLEVNSPTSAKQCVTNASGILVLASDKTTRHYLHNYMDFDNVNPVAFPDSATTGLNTSVVIDVTNNDTDPDGTIDPTSVFIVDNPSNGNASINSQIGEITYTPNAGFLGTDTMLYTVADNSGAHAIATTVKITVGAAANLPPVAENDTVSTTEGTAVVIDVTTNDNDPDGNIDKSTIAIDTPPSNGTAIVSVATGVVNYLPAPGFTGTDNFAYTVADNLGARSNVATVTVIVAAGGGTGGTFTFEPIDDAQVKFTNLTRNYGKKTTTKVEIGTFNSYFKFNVTGIFGEINSVILRLYVADRSNQGGTIHPASNNLQGTTIPWDEETIVGANAPVVDPNSALSSIVTPVEVGTFVEFDVKAAILGNGIYSFCISSTSINLAAYSTKEGTNPPKLIIVTGSGGGGNIPPVAENDSTTTSVDTPVNIDVTLNDTDIGGTINPSTVFITTPPTNGTAVVNASSGVVTDTPNAGFVGTDTFNYTVNDNNDAISNNALVKITVTGGGVNIPPVAVDDAATTTEATPIGIDVTSNDSDFDGTVDKSTVLISLHPVNATATVDPVTGVVTYTPNAGFVGNDSFTYTVKDNLGEESNIATVNITVNAVGAGGIFTFEPIDDAQVKFTNLTRNYGKKTTAKVEIGTFNSYFKFNVTGIFGEINSVILRLYVADRSNQGGTIHLVSNNLQGTTVPWDEETIVGANAPEVDPNSALTSILTPVEVGTFVEFDVKAAILGNGIYSFCISSTSINLAAYSTKEGTNPPQLIIVTGSGGGGNIPPVTNNDSTMTNADMPVNIDVTLNDTDIDGTINPSTVFITTPPTNGTAVVDATTGVVTYTSNAGFVGTDAFNYTVNDNDGATSNSALVKITVTGGGVNIPPVAVDDTATTNEGIAVALDVTSNDTDIDGTVDPSTVAIVNPPVNGTAFVNPTTGVVTYTPNAGFVGTDSLTYTVQDNSGLTSNEAKVTITVNAAGTGAVFTFEPIDDAQVKQTNPTKNYATKPHTKVELGTFNSYFKFDVTGLNAQVLSARLRLHVIDASNQGGTIHSASNNFKGTAIPWNEETLVAANAPDVDPNLALSSILSAVTIGQNVEFDVTTAIVGNGIFSFCINSSSTNLAAYSTKEGIQAPQLIIVTGDGGDNNLPSHQMTLEQPLRIRPL